MDEKKVELKGPLKNMYDNLITSVKESAENQVYGKIKERFFVDVWLPFFAGKVDELPNGMTFDTWQTIAGSLTSEVEVVDDFDKVLFRVPPILPTSSLHIRKANSHAKESLSQRISAIKNRSSVYKRQSEQLLKQELESNLPIKEDNDPFFDQYKIRWANIFNRYGYFDQVKLSTEKKVPTDEDLDDWDL